MRGVDCHTIPPENCHSEKVGERMQDEKDFESVADAAIVGLLDQLERVCYEKLVENLVVGDDDSIARAGHIAAIMKAVGLI